LTKKGGGTFSGGLRLFDAGVGGVEELGDVLRLHVRQGQLQVLEPGRRLQVLRVVVYRDDPADAVFALSKYDTPRVRAVGIAYVMSALGSTLSAKSRILPSPGAGFLGPLVHAPSLSLSVPPEKVKKVLRAVKGAIQEHVNI